MAIQIVSNIIPMIITAHVRIRMWGLCRYLIVDSRQAQFQDREPCSFRGEGVAIHL